MPGGSPTGRVPLLPSDAIELLQNDGKKDENPKKHQRGDHLRREDVPGAVDAPQPAAPVGADQRGREQPETGHGDELAQGDLRHSREEVHHKEGQHRDNPEGDQIVMAVALHFLIESREQDPVPLLHPVAQEVSGDEKSARGAERQPRDGKKRSRDNAEEETGGNHQSERTRHEEGGGNGQKKERKHGQRVVPFHEGAEHVALSPNPLEGDRLMKPGDPEAADYGGHARREADPHLGGTHDGTFHLL